MRMGMGARVPQRARRGGKSRAHAAVWHGKWGPGLKGWGEWRREGTVGWESRVGESGDPGWGSRGWGTRRGQESRAAGSRVRIGGGRRDPPVSGAGLHRVL